MVRTCKGAKSPRRIGIFEKLDTEDKITVSMSWEKVGRNLRKLVGLHKELSEKLRSISKKWKEGHLAKEHYISISHTCRNSVRKVK